MEMESILALLNLHDKIRSKCRNKYNMKYKKALPYYVKYGKQIRYIY